MLNSGLGRWLRRDPLGHVDGVSLLEYVASRPPLGVDETAALAELQQGLLDLIID